MAADAARAEQSASRTMAAWLWGNCVTAVTDHGLHGLQHLRVPAAAVLTAARAGEALTACTWVVFKSPIMLSTCIMLALEGNLQSHLVNSRSNDYIEARWPSFQAVGPSSLEANWIVATTTKMGVCEFILLSPGACTACVCFAASYRRCTLPSS